jgi:hypothetical protein
MSELTGEGTARLGVYDALESRVLAAVSDVLAKTGARALVFKGAAVARLAYAESWQRRRADADLLIRREDWQMVDRGLQAAIGPRLQIAIDPDAMGQWQYRDRQSGLLLDVHWRLFEPAPLAGLVSFADLDHDSVPLPGLAGLRAPGLTHALWIALIHPVAHHDAAADPVWDDDIRRLAARMTADEWDRFVALCERTGTCTICAAGLEGAGVEVAAARRDRLRVAGERTADLLRAGPRSAIARHVAFLRAMPGWAARVRELRRRLFPPADYMRALYGVPGSSRVLPLYVRRIAAGLAGSWRASSRPPDDRFTGGAG